MKKKLWIGIMSLFAAVFAVFGFVFLPSAVTVAEEAKTVYRLSFDSPVGSSSATIGAENAPSLSDGQTVTMQFTVEEFTADNSGNWIFAFLIAGPNSIQSNWPAESQGTVMCYVRRDNNFTWIAQDQNVLNESGGRKNLATSYKSFDKVMTAGKTVKAVYKPYYGEGDEGTLDIFVKNAYDATAEFEPVASVSGLTEKEAPTTRGLYLTVWGKMEMLVSDYTITTSNGVDLGITKAWSGDGTASVTKTKLGAVQYKVTFTESVSYFGQQTGVTLADDETLTMEFDVLSNNFGIDNYNMGYIVSTVTDFNTTWVSATHTNAFSYRVNYYPNLTGTISAKNPNGSGEINNASIAENVSAAFSPAEVYGAGKSVRAVYAPYVSETQKGSIKIYGKDAAAEDSAYTLLSEVTGIAEAFAPSENVRIFFEVAKSAPWVTDKDLVMQIENYRVYTQSVSNIPALGSHKACSVEKIESGTTPEQPEQPEQPEVKDLGVKHATVNSTSSGYFAGNVPFPKADTETVEMEFSILESDSKTSNVWLGFAFGGGLGPYMYTSGGLMYFRGTGAYGVSATVESVQKPAELKYIFGAGKRIKGTIDLTQNKFFLYRKNIGEKSYGDPYAVFDISGATIPNNIYFGICVQNGVWLELADIAYYHNGVEQDFELKSSLSLSTESLPETDRALTLTANKTANGAGGVVYAYDEPVQKDSEISFRLVRGEDLALKFSQTKGAFDSGVSFALDQGKDFYQVSFDGETLSLKGKNLFDETYTLLETQAFASETAYFAFSLENSSVYAKTALLDDLSIVSGETTTSFDFDFGASESFTATVTGRSKAAVSFEYHIVTFYYPDGSIASVQRVGDGNAAELPAGEYSNLDEILPKISEVFADISVLLIRTTDELDYFTLTVENGSFDGESSVFVKKGSQATVTANAAPTGYIFSHWEVDGVKGSENAAYTFTVEKSSHFRAIYKKENGKAEYVVSLTGGSFADGSSERSAEEGSTVKAIAGTPQTGYRFVGWFDGATLVSELSEYEFTVSKTLSLTAKYEIIRVTVTVSGGTLNGSNTSLTVDYGETVAVVAGATPSEKVFVGWFDGDTLASESERYEFTAKTDVSLVAKYKDKTYLVTVENGLANGESSVEAVLNTTLALSANAAQTGSTFSHWEEDGVKISEESVFTYTVKKSATLRAVYVLIDYTVSVTNGRIDGDQTSVTVPYGTEVTVLANVAPEKQVFVGWFDGETLVSKLDRYSFKVEGNLALTAKYGAITYSITVVNGSVNGNSQTEAAVDSIVELVANQPNEGYQFAYWLVNGEKAGEESNLSWTVTGDMTASAVYERLTYTISVVGGTLTAESSQVSHGETVGVTASGKKGYKFVGWYDGEERVSKDSYFEWTVTSSRSLTAKYEKIDEGCGSVAFGVPSTVALLSLALLKAFKRKEDR